ncbi:reverse transcriptase-like protein, partial [Escherichia coli]
MVGIDPNVISHKLNVDPTFKPIKQKRRKFAPERNKVINDEVDNLLKTGKIREVKYPDWLANVVVVQKKNGKWRVCIDFTDLNKACPKDPFPLPHIDAMVDATAGHELLTFMDAYSGYNQILMHTNDQEKTAFMTDKGIYCYKVMPFGLKNAGSTYQRLVNMMFKEHLGRTMEVYIDDMLVKSERSIDHVTHLRQSFDILRQYKMKLNPTKCSFGVRAGKFLGYLVTQRGIEASPEQVKAIIEIQSPRNVKEVQKLTGRVAALNRFISRSSDKCHLFYNVLRKNQGFLWTDEHEKALQELKKYMVSPPLLTKPVEGESLQLYLAVSEHATSAVLVREEDQQQRPIYYVSKSFLDAETRYTSMEKLLLGLMTAAKKLRHYFESHHIIVVTNYPLKTVLRKPELTGRLAKWSIYLSGFDIEFKPRTAIKSQALADFVAEFSPGLEPTTCDEVNNVMISDNNPWLLYVDGSSNVRGCGLGVVLKSSQGGNLVYSIRCEFKATNNEAEYEALIAGLDIALRLGAKQLNVRSDSLLVVNQINGDFQAKDSRMTSYLKAVKDRIARFEGFSIEQISRDLNMQADALANLGSAFNDPFMESIPILHLTTPAIETKEEVQMNEEVYNWSIDIWNYLKHDRLPKDKMEARKTRAKASRYTIFENKLYRRSTSGLLLRCITSKVQIDKILQEMHDGECGNHAGGRSLANRISRQGYYWPTLREDAVRYVRHCDACQKHSGMTHRPSEPLHSVLIPWPFMRWGMDIVGKLPPAPGQKVYLLVLTDYFSKWIEAAAYSQVRDKEVISFIQNNIIYRFGIPSEIMCDNGSQFISDKTRTFCEERGIKLVTSTPRYPQSNGLAESSNKVIINSIRKRLKGAKGKWVEELPSVLWANRTTPRTSTGQTPYSLVYGCEAVLPIEAQVPIARNRTFEQNAINLSHDLDALEELRENALRTMASQKGIVERYFNKKVKAKIFQVGDYVLRHVFQNTQEPNAGKLSIKWEGPYIISKTIGNGAYKLTTMEGIEIPR